MVLWDTPGFGNVAVLLKRLRKADSPIGWLLAQVWDRFRDRPLWCSQQAVKNVQAEADVVLYLVDANQNPSLAGYVDLEMEVLAWIGKPVIVALNQLGPPQGPERERADVERWTAALARHAVVRETLALDAFARCWTQEGRLFEAIGRQLPADKADALESIRRAWQARSLAIFRDSMQALAAQLAQAAREREPIATAGWQDRLRVAAGPLFGRKIDGPTATAIATLNLRLNAGIVESTNRLIALHRLAGKAGDELLEDLQDSILVDEPVQEVKAGVAAAVVSGALGGLAADLAAGGFTLGGGALVGAILGGASAIVLTRGYNRVWRKGRAEVRCSTELLVRLLQGALLRYLAVAHYGRGRGPWRQTQAPKRWRDEVDELVRAHRQQVEAALAGAGNPGPDGHGALGELVGTLARSALLRLHPGTGQVFEEVPAASP
jgi:hypothetical protein